MNVVKLMETYRMASAVARPVLAGLTPLRREEVHDTYRVVVDFRWALAHEDVFHTGDAGSLG
jgi:hypothetical protein